MAINLRYRGMPMCQFCERELSGRSDKKFCNDTCRNAHNNGRQKEMRSAEPIFIKMVLDILKRNRKILMRLDPSPKKPIMVSKARLEALDFNFDFITSTLETHKGHHYRYCFDHGYRILEDDKIMVVISETQMELL